MCSSKFDKIFENVPFLRTFFKDKNVCPDMIVKPQWDYSFPSGHTAASFSVSSVLPYMKMKKRYSIPALVLALLIALSRIYVCVHYPTDVICGAVLGGMAGFAGFMLYTRVIEKKAPKKLMKFIFNFPGIETKEK